MTLRQILIKHQSDKALGGHPVRRSHNYDIVYEKLFEPIRHEKLNILELGIGSIDKHKHSMGPAVRPGASLRAWKEYFENSNIYGADIDKRTLFTEDRIQTFEVDQTNPDSIKKLKQRIPICNIIIDDGWHNAPANIEFYKNMIDHCSGFYIIEDIRELQKAAFFEFFNTIKHSWAFHQLAGTQKKDNNLIVVCK